MQRSVGILGLGVYMPPEVRTNDWWSAELVERWKNPPVRDDGASDPAKPPASGPVRAAAELLATDPFRGSLRRHVMPPGMDASEMEIEAGRRALAAAAVDPADIDLVLLCPFVPDLQGTNCACTVHEALGLARASISLSIDSNLNGLHHQISIARSLIMTGQARRALLIQSSSISRLLDYEASYSPWLGDGATAVVVGEVGDGFGVFADAHRTDGSLQLALHTGVPGGRWFNEGRSILFSERPERQQEVVERVCESSRDVITSALAAAKIDRQDVDFYAGHQGTWWYRHVTQHTAGLDHARTIDSFWCNGSMAACNIPMCWSLALDRGLLHDGDIVVTHAGGNGSTWSALVMRWGTGT